MKIRTDYVSNSSSSSFIVVCDADYSKKELIDDLTVASVARVDEYTKDWVDNYKDHNFSVLNYRLNMVECLFIGSIKYHSDEYDWDEYITNPIALKSDIHYIIQQYCDYDIDMSDKSKYKEIAENIMKYVESLKKLDGFNHYSQLRGETCFISKRTIKNTRALLEADVGLILPKWADLDKLEQMLNDGKKILSIDIHQGGDGMDEVSLYALGGWEGLGIISENKRLEIIHTEIG
jgi:hypothetical protein